MIKAELLKALDGVPDNAIVYLRGSYYGEEEESHSVKFQDYIEKDCDKDICRVVIIVSA